MKTCATCIHYRPGWTKLGKPTKREQGLCAFRPTVSMAQRWSMNEQPYVWHDTKAEGCGVYEGKK